MIFPRKITNLMESEHRMLREIGYVLFDRQDKNGGLTAEELERVLDALELFDEALESAREEGFEEGYRFGKADSYSSNNDSTLNNMKEAISEKIRTVLIR